MKLKRLRAGVSTLVDVEVFEPNIKAPVYIERNVEPIEGERYARRPSYLAKVAGKRSASELLVADDYVGGADDWTGADPMPYKTRLMIDPVECTLYRAEFARCGWHAMSRRCLLVRNALIECGAANASPYTSSGRLMPPVLLARVCVCVVCVRVCVCVCVCVV